MLSARRSSLSASASSAFALSRSFNLASSASFCNSRAWSLCRCANRRIASTSRLWSYGIQFGLGFFGGKCGHGGNGNTGSFGVVGAGQGKGGMTGGGFWIGCGCGVTVPYTTKSKRNGAPKGDRLYAAATSIGCGIARISMDRMSISYDSPRTGELRSGTNSSRDSSQLYGAAGLQE